MALTNQSQYDAKFVTGEEGKKKKEKEWLQLKTGIIFICFQFIKFGQQIDHIIGKLAVLSHNKYFLSLP